MPDERTSDSSRLDENAPAAITSQMSDEDILKLAELHEELLNRSTSAIIRHFVTMRKSVREAQGCLKECDTCYKMRKLVCVLAKA